MSVHKTSHEEHKPGCEGCQILALLDEVADLRAKLAVFEQAHTPTNDERETLLLEKIKTAGHVMSEGMIYPYSDYPVKAIPYTRFLDMLAGFRRPEVPKPLDRSDPRQRSEYLAASKADAAMADWRPRVEVPEPQGEPTDAQVEAGHNAALFNGARQVKRSDIRAALRAALNTADTETERGER